MNDGTRAEIDGPELSYHGVAKGHFERFHSQRNTGCIFFFFFFYLKT
jgi:hypothetical protein